METNESQTWELGFSETPEIDLSAAGYPLDVETIEPGETPAVIVPNRGRPPQVRIHNEGNVVHVELDWDTSESILGWLKWGKPSRLIVKLPRGIRGRMKTGAGSIRVRDLRECDLALETGAGSIHAGHVTGRLALTTYAGSIHVDDAEGSVSLHTYAGSIRARIRDLDPGTHEVHSDAGSVRVELGPSTRVNVVPNVAFGHAKIDMPSYMDAAAILRVGSSAGSVSVRLWADGSRSVRPKGSPYREPAPRVFRNTGELERVLEMVADKKLTPDEAGEILRALGEVG
jgi:hypothetical protein